MRSARTVSRVIRMTLGGVAAAASTLAPSQTTHTKRRIRDIGKSLSLITYHLSLVTGHWKDLRLELALLSACEITSATRQRVAFWLQREPWAFSVLPFAEPIGRTSDK